VTVFKQKKRARNHPLKTGLSVDPLKKKRIQSPHTSSFCVFAFSLCWMEGVKQTRMIAGDVGLGGLPLRVVVAVAGEVVAPSLLAVWVVVWVALVLVFQEMAVQQQQPL
jgi:hypothetical protein